MPFRRRSKETLKVSKHTLRGVEGSERCFFCGKEVTDALRGPHASLMVVAQQELRDGMMGWSCHLECVKSLRHPDVEWPT